MNVHCYCGEGYELYYKTKKQLLHPFDAFCGEHCLLKYLKENNLFGGGDIEVIPNIYPSDMSPPCEYWCKETKRFYRSRSEATFARWCNFNGIIWEYEPYKIWLDHRMPYTPDFWLPALGHFIEVKGVWSGRSKKKMRIAKGFGVPLVLVPDHLIHKLTRSKISNV